MRRERLFWQPVVSSCQGRAPITPWIIRLYLEGENQSLQISLEFGREAANAVVSNLSTTSLDALDGLQKAYRFPVTDEVFLLPTSG